MKNKCEIKRTSKFNRDLKTIIKRNKDISLLDEVIQKLANNERLPDKNRDCALSGNYNQT